MLNIPQTFSFYTIIATWVRKIFKLEVIRCLFFQNICSYNSPLCKIAAGKRFCQLLASAKKQ